MRRRNATQTGAVASRAVSGGLEAAGCDVSIVLPVHNEQGHLEAEVSRIRAAMDASEFSYEIIAVDDGSTDGSGEALAALAGEGEGFLLIRHATKRGVGTARKTGTAAARGDVVVWTDVDMSYPNDEIPRLVKELEGHDQVVGARRLERGTIRFLRIPAKWFVRRLASYLMRTPIPDLNSGFRAFRRPVGAQYLHLLPPGFSCVTTMTMSFLAGGYSVKYVPIEYSARAGESKFHWWTDTKKYVIQVIRLVLSYNPLRFFLPLGTVLLSIGVGKLAYDWAERDFRLATNTLLVFFAALQVFAIGLLADLVVRTHQPRDAVPPATG